MRQPVVVILDTGRALGLMDTIAPGLSVLERTKAAELLAKLFAADGWDDADGSQAASVDSWE